MRSAVALLRQRNFGLLFSGRCISFLGNAMAPVALAFAVLQLSGSASALGVVLAARMAPNIVFLLIGGVIADRLPRSGARWDECRRRRCTGGRGAAAAVRARRSLAARD